MDAVFLKLLNMSITAGWIILAVFVLRLLLRRMPKRFICALWAIAAVRLVCPLSFESAFSLIPSAETVSPEVVRYEKEPAIDSGVPVINDVLNPVVRDNFTRTPGASVNPLQVWVWAASVVWAVGLAAMLGYAAVSYLRIRKQVQESVPLWNKLDKMDNIRLCDTVQSPFILGIVRPQIYLPSGMDEEQMSSVLAHERVHLRRGDHIWKPFAFLLLSVYWFHPLVWAAYILFCRDMELACDERAVMDMDFDGKKAYCQALLACSMPKRVMLSHPLAFREGRVKQRVKLVLHYRKPAFWVMAAAAILCAAVAVCFLTDPRKDGGEKTGEEQERSAIIPMVMVGDRYYYDTGRVITRTGTNTDTDGEIVSAVNVWERPQENNQSNFGAGYCYRYGEGDTIEVCIDEKWAVFEYRSGDGSQIRYLDRWYSRGDLSDETIEWLEWYNGLPEEEQLAVDHVPHDLYELGWGGAALDLPVMTEDAASGKGQAAGNSEPALQAMFDTFGISIHLPENEGWIQNREYRQPDENTMEISYYDATANADCTLLAVRGGSPELPEIVYEESLEGTWEGHSDSGEYVKVRVQRSRDGKQVLAAWAYGEYQFAILADVLWEDADEADIGSIPKTALAVISNL